MDVEVTIVADETELDTITELIETIKNETEVEISEGENDGSGNPDLSEREEYVIAALQSNPRSALRVVHREATSIEGSPFDDYAQNDGWNDERKEVREILWSLKNDGLVKNDGQLWYPTDAAPSNILD